MPVDYYPNKSIEELQVILEKLQSRQLQGGISEVSAAGVKVVRAFAGSGNSKAEVEILRVLYSLHLRAASTDESALYPNPYRSRVTRTRAYYRADSQTEEL